MNCPSARSIRASWPRRTTKREPESFVVLRGQLARSTVESDEFYDFYVQQVVVRELSESAIIEIRPDGIPRTDYYPLLALLKRTLTEDEVVQAAFSVLKDSDPDDPVTAEQIRAAIRETTEKEPTGLEINQVAARLASVGWPLTDHS